MTPAVVIGGGQSGLAAAYALRRHGWEPIILEAGDEPVGSWPHYYDSLVVFTVARFSQLPGLRFPGDPHHFPSRDEVVDYLRSYAARLDCEIHTGQRVTAVTGSGDGYLVRTEAGLEFGAPAVVAATGSFGHPHRPGLGLDRFTGTVLHAAEYRRPEPFAGQRVVVVGAGNSAVQIAVELAQHARTTIASRTKPPLRSMKPRRVPEWGWRLTETLLRAPIGPLFGDKNLLGAIVLDYGGGYRAALRRGEPDRRAMFTDVEGARLRWPDGREEHVDTIILATGYRVRMDYLRPLGAVDDAGAPLQRRGLSTTCPGLGFVGLENQNTVLSAALHGVGVDADRVARGLRRHTAGTSPLTPRRVNRSYRPGA